MKGKGRCFSWTIPESVPTGKCELRLHGGSGLWQIDDKQEVKVVDTHQITFIQTDKPVYKPGETGYCINDVCLFVC